ncbi:MAG: phosphatidylserine decarboxylase [Eubacterium sp.]
MKDNIKEESGILKFLYHTVPGRMVLKLITCPTISKIGGAYMDSRLSGIHIKGFIKRNKIDMSQYEKTDFKCFNQFFTRKILKDKRPVGDKKQDLISPCDGRLSVYRISENSDFYIKKSYYSVKDLIRNSKKAPDYNGGICLVFRLCVDDYHRYGNIDDGEILENRYIKGKLHTVRPIALNRYPVFVHNSREYTIIETENFGTIAQIEVGALMIGKIKNHQKTGSVVRGSEKGMFLYGGSTIVVLFEKDKVEIPEKLFEDTGNDIETIVKFGSVIGKKR